MIRPMKSHQSDHLKRSNVTHQNWSEMERKNMKYKIGLKTYIYVQFLICSSRIRLNTLLFSEMILVRK